MPRDRIRKINNVFFMALGFECFGYMKVHLIGVAKPSTHVAIVIIHVRRLSIMCQLFQSCCRDGTAAGSPVREGWEGDVLIPGVIALIFSA
jgi:hypothetical protein